MNCRQVVELMTDYIEGTLAPAERARFEDHIAGCDGCTAYLEQMRITRRIVGKLADVPMPQSVERELLAAFRNWMRA
jgi:anti-sigma factor RsiW